MRHFRHFQVFVRFAVALVALLGLAVVAMAQAQVAVNVSSTPTTGIAITASPPDIGGLSGGTTNFTLNYGQGTSVTLTAPLNAPGVTFDHWTIAGVDQPVGQNVVNFRIPAAPPTLSAVAVYDRNTDTLTVQSQNPNSGVTVTASPPDLRAASSGVTTFALTYTDTTKVTLTAPASAGGMPFSHWNVGGVNEPAGQNAVVIIMAGVTTAIAVYSQVWTITTTVAGTHGAVNPSGSVVVVDGANQTFTATPASGYTVNQWVLDGATAQMGGATFQVSTVHANHTLSVSFKVIPVLHPADKNGDGNLTIGEITAYGAAWKHGAAWPSGPSPIPQTFITNAIALWKSGEAYTYDPSKAQPDAWIPLSEATLSIKNPTAASATTPGTVVSTITRQADGSWLVSITVTPPVGAKAYTLEESVPKGVAIFAITSGGVRDPKSGVIRWGPFLNSQTRIFGYRIKGAATLSGAASFDGATVKTTGDRKVGAK